MSFVALIAGEGIMPLKVIREIHSQGKKVLLIGINGVTDRKLESQVEKAVWGRATQIGKARKTCLRNNVKEAVMAGLVRHNSIFSLSLLFMDFVTLKAFLSLKDLRTNTICNKIIEIFQKKGISFLNTAEVLKKYLAPKGQLTNRKPTKKILEDMEFGIKVAKEMGRLDVGQCVVVKNKSIVAVEAMEGTDLCLQRAGDIAGKGCVVIKVAKPKQDQRYDVPLIGLNTIEKLVRIEASAIVIEANETIIIDEEVIELANKHNIVILSVEL